MSYPKNRKSVIKFIVSTQKCKFSRWISLFDWIIPDFSGNKNGKTRNWGIKRKKMENFKNRKFQPLIFFVPRRLEGCKRHSKEWRLRPSNHQETIWMLLWFWHRVRCSNAVHLTLIFHISPAGCQMSFGKHCFCRVVSSFQSPWPSCCDSLAPAKHEIPLNHSDCN